MWYKCENGSLDRPQDIDSTSSAIYVYVRKDIVEVPATEGEGRDGRPAHYEWMETKIPKQDWEIYEQVLSHNEALDDVYAALTELAELIVGE